MIFFMTVVLFQSAKVHIFFDSNTVTNEKMSDANYRKSTGNNYLNYFHEELARFSINNFGVRKSLISAPRTDALS